MAIQRGLWIAALAGLLCAGGSPAAVMPLLTRLGPAVAPAADEDTTLYKVVKNEEEQYNIWPADRVNKLGWTDAGKTGTKEECLAWINEVWTDMRPGSLRRAMEAREGASPPAPAPVAPPPAPAPQVEYAPTVAAPRYGAALGRVSPCWQRQKEHCWVRDNHHNPQCRKHPRRVAVLADIKQNRKHWQYRKWANPRRIELAARSGQTLHCNEQT